MAVLTFIQTVWYMGYLTIEFSPGHTKRLGLKKWNFNFWQQNFFCHLITPLCLIVCHWIDDLCDLNYLDWAWGNVEYLIRLLSKMKFHTWLGPAHPGKCSGHLFFCSTFVVNIVPSLSLIGPPLGFIFLAMILVIGLKVSLFYLPVPPSQPMAQ